MDIMAGNMGTVHFFHYAHRKFAIMMVRRRKKRIVLSRSCQWKRPSMGAQKNEFGERHEVLTTIGCEVKSLKPRARNLFRFLQSRPISNELYINFPPHEDGKTFNMNENYSIKFRIGIHGPTITVPCALTWSFSGFYIRPDHCPLNPGPSPHIPF